MAEHSLALLVGPDAAGDSFGSHLPLVAEASGDAFMLEGHMARANPHWGWLSQQKSVVSGGPSAYVSPSHCDSVKNVPTWNYAALHAYGDVELIDGLADKDALLKPHRPLRARLRRAVAWPAGGLPAQAAGRHRGLSHPHDALGAQAQAEPEPRGG
jgi:predicted FMN-binding regulatory protein PaiB